MNHFAWQAQLGAPLAVVLGILMCFWGYRLLKVMLGVVGAIVGASAGWSFGMGLASANHVVALVCAVVAGLIGAALCVWLFFLGVFLLGASVGAIAASAFFGTAGTQPNPIIIVVVAVIFGVLALVLQKFMIIVATAFNGSYLVTAALLHLLGGGQNSTVWLYPPQAGPLGTRGMVALVFWIVLGVVGVSVQYASSRRRGEVQKQTAQTAPP